MAADEGWRAAAHDVMMVRLLAIQYVPSPNGDGLGCRLEVALVHDGHLALHRVIDSGTVFPSAPRRRDGDTLYRAVSVALEALQPELMRVLAH